MTTIRSYQNNAEAALLDESAHDYTIIAPIRLQVLDEQVEEANAFLEAAPTPPGELPPSVE